MAMLSDWGGGSTKPSSAMDVLRGTAPRIGAPVPKPSGTPWASPSPVPIQQAAPIQQAPIPMQNFTQGAGVQQAALYGGGPAQSAPISGGGGYGGGGSAAPAPARPRDYASFTDQEAATDSTFMDQKSAYANALKKFIEDNDRQSMILDKDAGIAQEGIGRNRTNGLTGLSEDFAARGLSNSGMFTQELDKADNQYDRQSDQVRSGLKNAKDDLGFRRAKYEQENGENGTNIQAARREAFARLAASQGLT